MGHRILNPYKSQKAGMRIMGAMLISRLIIFPELSLMRLFKKFKSFTFCSAGLSLEGLIPLGYEPDLFEPETETANRKLQEAVNKIQNRYGASKISRGLVLAASKMQGGKRLPAAGALNGF
jgi:hypothetical protein